MSTPIAEPDDLSLYLGQTVDDDRATQLLAIAQGYCEDIATPLPASAFGVVLASAARAYVNPQQNTNEALGPYTVGRAANVYLTRAERAMLRRGAGRAGGGSVSTLNPGIDAVQIVILAATAGTFTLSLDGNTTAALAYNATAADIQTALGALSNIGSANVTVSGVGTFTVTFGNSLGRRPVSLLVADRSSLTGTVTTANVTTGVFAAGANLPPWGYDYNAAVGSTW